MISTKFIRLSFDKLARTHKIARSLSPRVLVPKPVPTGSAYVTHAPQEPHFGSDKEKAGGSSGDGSSASGSICSGSSVVRSSDGGSSAGGSSVERSSAVEAVVIGAVLWKQWWWKQ